MSKKKSQYKPDGDSAELNSGTRCHAPLGGSADSCAGVYARSLPEKSYLRMGAGKLVNIVEQTYYVDVDGKQVEPELTPDMEYYRIDALSMKEAKFFLRQYLALCKPYEEAHGIGMIPDGKTIDLNIQASRKQYDSPEQMLRCLHAARKLRVQQETWKRINRKRAEDLKKKMAQSVSAEEAIKLLSMPNMKWITQDKQGKVKKEWIVLAQDR